MNIDHDSIERLRASRAKANAEREADGKKVGRTWAQTEAEFDELRRVADIDANALCGECDDAATQLASAFLDNEAPSKMEAIGAMVLLFGRIEPSFHEIVGFMHGAAEVFALV